MFFDLDLHKTREAMLYYLYMMSDGAISYSEEKLFDEICKELELDEEGKRFAVDKSKEVAKDPKDAFNTILSERLDEQVGHEWFGLGSKSTLARVIWNLVNLGYADTCYSDEEKKIVNHLVEKWEIDKGIYQEMVDTADTMLALTKQKEWMISTFPNGRERDEKEKRIDSEIHTMLSDIKLTIEEMTM